MHRRATCTAILLACATATAAFASVPGTDEADIGTATANQRLDDAAGAAVVSSLRTQFPGRDVEFKLDAIDSERVSLRDLALDGAGRIRIEGSDGWLPIRFEALYDTADGTVLSPAITLDRNPAAPPETPVDGLDQAVAAALGEEFASQDVVFELGSAWRTGGNARYAVVDGDGVADFAGEGAAEVRLQAVYDTQEERWIHVGYALDGEPMPAAPAVASR